MQWCDKSFQAHFPLGEAEEHQETATPKEEPETSGDEPLGLESLKFGHLLILLLIY